VLTPILTTSFLGFFGFGFFGFDMAISFLDGFDPHEGPSGVFAAGVPP
jgi:hypothetical protein